MAHRDTERALQGSAVPALLWSKPCDSFPAKTEQLPDSVMGVPGFWAMLRRGNWQLCALLRGKNLEGRKKGMCANLAESRAANLAVGEELGS